MCKRFTAIDDEDGESIESTIKINYTRVRHLDTNPIQPSNRPALSTSHIAYGGIPPVRSLVLSYSFLATLFHTLRNRFLQ